MQDFYVNTTKKPILLPHSFVTTMPTKYENAKISCFPSLLRISVYSLSPPCSLPFCLKRGYKCFFVSSHCTLDLSCLKAFSYSVPSLTHPSYST